MGNMLAFDKQTGALLWKTKLDEHPAAIITQSATVFDGRVYVGVASQEEALAAVRPAFRLMSDRCTLTGVASKRAVKATSPAPTSGDTSFPHQCASALSEGELAEIVPDPSLGPTVPS